MDSEPAFYSQRSISKAKVKELLNYDRSDLFKRPPYFNCPPINFENEEEPGWMTLAKVVLDDPQFVKIAIDNKHEPDYHFTGRQNYLERKQKLAVELKRQREAEHEANLKKNANMTKQEKALLSRNKKRNTRKRTNSELLDTQSSQRSMSKFSKDRRKSIISPQPQSPKTKTSKPVRRHKRRNHNHTDRQHYKSKSYKRPLKEGKILCRANG